MNKICGYSCEHNKSGVCQISVCDKKSNISDKTETQTFTRYIDPVIKELQQENKQLKDNWNKLKKYINKYIKYDKDGRKISKCLNAIVIMNKINKLEQGSDSGE